LQYYSPTYYVPIPTTDLHFHYIIYIYIHIRGPAGLPNPDLQFGTLETANIHQIYSHS